MENRDRQESQHKSNNPHGGLSQISNRRQYLVYGLCGQEYPAGWRIREKAARYSIPWSR